MGGAGTFRCGRGSRATWIVILTILFEWHVASAEDRHLDPVRDTFAFSNETFFAYGNQHHDAGEVLIHSGPPYSRRCFVLCRAAMQFHQFAEFAPQLPPLSENEYRKRIRTISRSPVSQKRNSPRILIPGFASLQKFSAAYPRLLQENLGTWWPTYFRFGNWRMVFPFPRSGQRHLAERLTWTIDSRELAAVYITRFKPLNHCLLVHSYETTQAGIDFRVYDPNFIGKTCHLIFDNATSSFFYQKTWYFPGGRVNALQVYHTRWL